MKPLWDYALMFAVYYGIVYMAIGFAGCISDEGLENIYDNKKFIRWSCFLVAFVLMIDYIF